MPSGTRPGAPATAASRCCRGSGPTASCAASAPPSSTRRAATSRPASATSAWCRSTCRRARRVPSARPPSSASWASSGRRRYLLCGDWNIAHREIDLRNWRSNQKNSGFLPEERAWLDGLFGDHGFVDGFRAVDPRPDQYTWWSNRGQAWAKNVGWRIDYQVSTPNLRGTARAATIHKDTRFSDHAPLLMDYAVDG
jgi:hypothetical protein